MSDPVSAWSSLQQEDCMCIDVYQADTTPNGPSEDALIYSLLFFRQEAFCDAAWYPCLDAVRFLVESF